MQNTTEPLAMSLEEVKTHFLNGQKTDCVKRFLRKIQNWTEAGLVFRFSVESNEFYGVAIFAQTSARPMFGGASQILAWTLHLPGFATATSAIAQRASLKWMGGHSPATAYAEESLAAMTAQEILASNNRCSK